MTRLILASLVLAISILRLYAQSSSLHTDRSGYTTGTDDIKPGFYLVIDAHCRVLSPPIKSTVTFPFKFTPHTALRAPGPATRPPRRRAA